MNDIRYSSIRLYQTFTCFQKFVILVLLYRIYLLLYEIKGKNIIWMIPESLYKHFKVITKSIGFSNLPLYGNRTLCSGLYFIIDKFKLLCAKKERLRDPSTKLHTGPEWNCFVKKTYKVKILQTCKNLTRLLSSIYRASKMIIYRAISMTLGVLLQFWKSRTFLNEMISFWTSVHWLVRYLVRLRWCLRP